MKDRAIFPEIRPVRLFLSYSHSDVTWFRRVKTLIKFRQATMPTRVWHDQELWAGCPWDTEIRNELERMDVFVCLVSHHFQFSDYVMEVELPRAQERHEAGEIEVVPILLEPFNLDKDVPFLKGLNQLPAFGRPWSTYNPRSNANVPIRDGVRQAIEKAMARRNAKDC